MISFLYQMIYGYVNVCFSGKNAERCLNLCVRQNIYIWNVQLNSDDSICFYMYRKDLYKCKNVLRKTHTKLKVMERFGLPFLSFRYRKRKLFPIALLIVSLLVLYYSQFIWKIEIIGNSYLSENTLIAYLQEKGAGFGEQKKNLDCSKLELEIRNDFEQVIWASAYLEGTKLVIELQENISQAKPTQLTTQSVSEQETCYDLIASKDAVITSMITRTGTPCVRIGQEVKEGDILVSGRQEIPDDSGEVSAYFYQTADADVKGVVIYSYEDRIPITWQDEVESGKKRSKLELKWKDWMFETPFIFPIYEHSHVLEECTQIQLAPNFYLPLFVGTKNYFEYENIEKSNDESEAKQIAQLHLEQYIQRLEENGVQIISKNVMMDKKTYNYEITGEIKACESITRQMETERKEIMQEGTTIDEHE